MGQPVMISHNTAKQSEPGELKHLSNRRKRKQQVNTLVEAIEKVRAQTRAVTATLGCGSTESRALQAKHEMESSDNKGDSPVCVKRCLRGGYPE